MSAGTFNDVDDLIGCSWRRMGPVCRVTAADADAVERGDKTWFPPSLVPEAEHDLVRKLGREAMSELQLRAAHGALGGGIFYEETIVDPACNLLRWDSPNLGLSDLMQDRINLIKEQEAGHSGDMFRTLRGLEARMRFPCSGAAPMPPSGATAGANDLLAQHELVWEAAMIETAISRPLADVRRDNNVVNSVRTSFEWHMIDETTHGACFSDLIGAYWPKLPADIRHHVAPRLAGYLRRFLEPDLRRIRGDLVAVGLEPDDADRVAADAYPEEKVRADMRRAARHPLKCMEKAGAFGDGAWRALEEAGLVDP